MAQKKQEGPLGGALKNVIAGLRYLRERPTKEEILGVWAKIVGKKASGHARPVSLNRTTLVVNVDGSGWLYELTLKKKEICKSLEGELRGVKVKDIRFRIGEIK